MNKFSFEKLNVYQKTLDIIDTIYLMVDNFPSQENYNLKSQIIRSSTSIALNIAEGYGDTDVQFNRFLKIAKGSVHETVVCLTIAFRQGYIKKSEYEGRKESLTEVSKMIVGLQKKLNTNN